MRTHIFASIMTFRLSCLGDVPSYANTQTVESQLMPPPLPPHSRRSGHQNSNQYNDQSRDSGAVASNVSDANRGNRFSRNSAGINGGLTIYNNENLLNANSNSTDQLQSYGDTQTLRADDSRLQFRGLAINPNFNAGGVHNNQKSDNHSSSQNKQSAEPMAPSVIHSDLFLRIFFTLIH